jgi:muramoyltetrapeptide carboxypeptidase
MDRRQFINLTAAALLAPVSQGAAPPQRTAPIKPARLRAGHTIGLVNPAGATFHSVDVEIVTESMEALGLRVKPATHLLARYGYLAGTDLQRAGDLNALFGDPAVNAILAVRGGWGSSRILPLLDFELIRRHPKVLLGYSDITALLLGVHARTGLITFHGPVGVSRWNQFTADYVRRILWAGEAVTMRNPVEIGDNLTQVEDRVQTITPGRARGRLLGGNLTVLSAIVGSGYLPDWNGSILFLEDTREEIYRVDRMLTHLRLAGILDRISGFVFGRCTDCEPAQRYGSLTLEEVFADHIAPLGIPAWQGAMIGHIERQFTLPIGVEVEIDASRGTIRMLEAAVR